MGYEHFFGLHDAPFSLAPNPRYLFESTSHAAALQQLGYAIERHEPLILMTGEIGTGKTLLCRAVLERLDRKTFVSVITDPMLGRDDLLRQLLEDFGVISPDRTKSRLASRSDLVRALEDFLASLITLDAHAVVIVDEAQHVQPEVLEQIRLLSNIDAAKGTMLQIILSGQLDLESLLARPELRQVQQRVSRRIRLEPLGEMELQAYIAHRLAVGRVARSRMPGSGDLARALEEWHGAETGVLFTPDAVHAIWRWSAGLPRVVNVLCDRALEEAFADRQRTVDAALIDRTAAALRLDAATMAPASVPTSVTADDGVSNRAEVSAPSAAAASPGRARIAALAAGLIIVGAMAGWWVVRGGRTASGVAARSASAGRSPAPVSAPGRTTTAPPPIAPAPAPVDPAPAAPAAAAPSATVAQPSAETAVASPPAAASAAGFEIIVASFRTEDRAAAVMSQVTGLGLTARQRLLGGWQQVLAGPFASREEADAARLRLERAGLVGAQIVSVQR